MSKSKTIDPVQQATEHLRVAGLRLLKAEQKLAKGYTLLRLEEVVSARQCCDRAKKRLREEILEAGQA